MSTEPAMMAPVNSTSNSSLPWDEASSYPQRRLYYRLSVLLICLLPVQRFMLPFGLSLADVALILLVIVSLEYFWRVRQPLHFPLAGPIWLIMVASIGATMMGLQHFDSLVAIAQEVYLFIAFLVLVNLWSRLPSADMNRLMKIWCVIAALEALLALAAMFRIGPSILYVKPTQDASADYEIVRAIGVHANANAAAVYLSVAYFVALATRWPVWRRLIVAGTIYAGIFATGSNGALLSTAIATVILLITTSVLNGHRRGFLWGGLICTAIALLLMFYYALQTFVDFNASRVLAARNPYLFQTLGRFAHSLSNRIHLMGWGWEVFRDYPLGIGPNAFSTIRGSLHNDYIAFLFERGPLGFLGWLWLILETLVRPLAGLRVAGKVERWQILVLAAGFLACMLNAMSHEVSHMRQVWFLMALLFALSYSVVERHRSATKQQSAPVVRPAGTYL